MTDRLAVEDNGAIARALRSLDKLPGDLADTTTAARQAGEHVAGLARAAAPRRTGGLARSIRAAGPGEVTATARHAGPIERGVGPRPGQRGPHNITPARYMADAADQAGPAVLDTFTAAADKKLRKVK